jgi:hypothetical protein
VKGPALAAFVILAEVLLGELSVLNVMNTTVKLISA